MPQDFWASSGFALLERSDDGGLVATDAWLARFLDRDELKPPHDAGPHERHLHARLSAKPRLQVGPADLAQVEDPDARENWTHFLRFRDRVAAHSTLEAAYASLFREDAVGIAPPFVDALAQAILRGILDGTGDPWLCRAGELFFREQRVSTETGHAIAADARTIEQFQETGGFGNMGRLLRSQDVAIAIPKMDVMSHENAPLYFLRDELHGYLLDLTPGREGAAALASVIERWIGHFHGVRTRIEAVGKLENVRWVWHVGLDVDSTAILNALYRSEPVADDDRARLASLFRLDFVNPADTIDRVRGHPVYLGLAFRPDRTLKVKPQNLLVNLPLGPRT